MSLYIVLPLSLSLSRSPSDSLPLDISINNSQPHDVAPDEARLVLPPLRALDGRDELAQPGRDR